ncbi:inositol monophosphatase family protein [Sandaracinus amylolyticus]|uniref:Inositol-1-monophosphatase n=1 Tax=Sandaracinus amylolyticus TaxID=927083 RepID=A0A0F6YL77_9BACT|nr:inositol monophosphatase family protein [Sandaracinus amylolyticus]AKF10047.1 Inositol-1-monophosphatase [Sandaracinus amylolyticus]
MTTSELERLIDEARAIAIDAGQLLARAWRRGGRVEKKSAIDLVTEHDLASEALITARLRAAFPGITIVAEEAGGEIASGLAWYVDPLDGTTNFAHGHFVFSVSIGLAHHGAPIAGVVHAPAIGITWWGAEGVGAFRSVGGVLEQCRVSENDTLASSIIATGFPYDRAIDPDNNVRESARIIPQVQGIRRLGSAAMDLVLVADGTYDGYWEQKLAPWDLCAGAAIAKAAGATLTDYEGAPITLRPKNRVVCTNGRVHEVLRREVLAARAEL